MSHPQTGIHEKLPKLFCKEMRIYWWKHEKYWLLLFPRRSAYHTTSLYQQNKELPHVQEMLNMHQKIYQTLSEQFSQIQYSYMSSLHQIIMIVNLNLVYLWKVFLSILKKKTGQSQDGFVYAHQERGKPKKLLRVSKPQIGSSSASASTLKKRSQVIEKLAENLSSPSTSSSTTENDVIHQTAISIPRKQQQFINSLKEGGVNIIQSFTLIQVKPTLSVIRLRLCIINNLLYQ